MEPDLVQSKSIDSDRSELLQQRILKSVATHKCYSIKDLVVELQHTYSKSLSMEEIQHAVKKLENDKKITLLEPGINGHFFHYIMRGYNGVSLWLTTAATCLMMTIVFLLPNIEPWSYMRMITGAIFVLYIPGNALLQLLFVHRNIEHTEQMVLSIVLSIALISIIGLMLKYVLLGLTAESAVISIGILSITLSAVANYSHFLYSKRANDY
jgi:uncharacterized membrane protein